MNYVICFRIGSVPDVLHGSRDVVSKKCDDKVIFYVILRSATIYGAISGLFEMKYILLLMIE